MTDVTGIDPHRLVQRSGEARRAEAQDFAKALAYQRDESRHAAAPGGRAESARAEVVAPEAGPAAAVQSAMADRQATLLPTQALLDIAVQPVGVTQALRDARVYGMHALAGAYLSELAAADTEAPPEQPTASVAPAAEQVTAVQQSPASTVLAAMPAVSEVAPATASAATLPLFRISALQPESASLPTDPVTATLAGTQSRWPDSLLRLVRQRDGGTVAWIRDYRVQPGEVPALVAQLRDCARADGVALHRIMLNGREAWSSRQTD